MKLGEFLEKANRKHKGLNTDLIRQVSALLRAKPQSYSQGTYGYRNEGCGTIACIAGHAVLLSGMEYHDFQHIPGYRIHVFACNLLGLTDEQASLLFDGDACGWPEQYRARFQPDEDDDPIVPADVAADLLDAIADGKVKL